MAPVKFILCTVAIKAALFYSTVFYSTLFYSINTAAGENLVSTYFLFVRSLTMWKKVFDFDHPTFPWNQVEYLQCRVRLIGSGVQLLITQLHEDQIRRLSVGVTGQDGIRREAVAALQCH